MMVGGSTNGGLAESARGNPGVLFKEVDEMRALFETQAPGDLADVPAGMSEERFGLLCQAFGDQLRGGLTGHFAQSAVEVIDVDGELGGVLRGGAQGNLL